MKTNFNSFVEFGEHLSKIINSSLPVQIHRGLIAASELIEDSAKKEFGVYQDAAGPFDEWKELADSTKADRLRQGYSENEPLLRSGALRDSISHEVEGLEAAIGSTSDIMVWQELGTRTIPPRPVLGPAAFRNKEKIQQLIAGATVAGIMGKAYDYQSKTDALLGIAPRAPADTYIYEPGALGSEGEPPEL